MTKEQKIANKSVKVHSGGNAKIATIYFVDVNEIEMSKAQNNCKQLLFDKCTAIHINLIHAFVVY